MIIEEITVTAFQQHTRIVGCEETKQAICIDPGDEAERIVETLERRGLKARLQQGGALDTANYVSLTVQDPDGLGVQISGIARPGDTLYKSQ